MGQALGTSHLSSPVSWLVYCWGQRPACSLSSPHQGCLFSLSASWGTRSPSCRSPCHYHERWRETDLVPGCSSFLSFCPSFLPDGLTSGQQQMLRPRAPVVCVTSSHSHMQCSPHMRGSSPAPLICLMEGSRCVSLTPLTPVLFMVHFIWLLRAMVPHAHSPYLSLFKAYVMEWDSPFFPPVS